MGRPNVGKSSLLNALAGRRISIVDPTAGVTRDRISIAIVEDDRYFELVDTGGVGIEDAQKLTREVADQIRQALTEASGVLFVVDVRAGILPLDRQVAKLLRQSGRPSILIANKADSPELDSQAGGLCALGFGEPLCVSATHHRNLDELRRRALDMLPAGEKAPEEPVMKLAIVGKRNVGKSTLINTLAGQPRMIVSEVAGTTRDSVDVHFEWDGRPFIAIDTAGVRKPARLANDIEFYSQARTQRSIRRADVVLLLIDATLDVGSLERRLIAAIFEHDKPLVLVVNKWDLARGAADMDAYHRYLEKVLPGTDFVPISFSVALSGENVPSTVALAEDLFYQARKRVSTSELNAVMEEIWTDYPPPAGRGAGKSPRVYFATQVGIAPPTIVLSVNNPEKLNADYRRFLLRQFRERLPFSEIPIRLLLRHHRRKIPQ